MIDLETIKMKPGKEMRGYENSYRILSKDLRQTFEFVDPDISHWNVYSHRFYELLLRICTEFESHCKKICEIGLGNKQAKNIGHYSKLNGILSNEVKFYLSDFQFSLTDFDGKTIYPLNNFSNSNIKLVSPDWFRSYNDVKHNRSDNFKMATLGNVIESYCGLTAILYIQKINYTDAMIGCGNELIGRSHWGEFTPILFKCGCGKVHSHPNPF
jgi:hypothetical protein